MVGLFEEFMLLLFDHHAPVKIISIKPDKSFPWVTETLKQMMHLRNQALCMYRATKSESDKTSWKDLQVMVRTSMDAEKRAFFNHFVNSQVQNGKTFWKSLQLKALAIPSQESTLPYNLNDPNTINQHFLDVQCVEMSFQGTEPGPDMRSAVDQPVKLRNFNNLAIKQNGPYTVDARSRLPQLAPTWPLDCESGYQCAQ
ncbi:hypothetical protein ACJJTC_013829 [Scirpophaga incertulas]